jgi:hypothetical protein
LRARQACANVRDVNLSPVLALAGLAAIGLLVTRLPRPAWRRVPWLDPVLAAGGPLVLLGVILGPGTVPGIDFLDRSVLRSLAPVTALAIGWIGAGLGVQFEWRSVRRISRRAWLLAALPSGAAFGAVALGAWMLTRALPAVAAAWTPRLAAILTLAAVAAVSGPGVVALVAREAGLRRSTARGLVRAASLETLVGALLFIVPVALHRGHWLTTIAFAVGSAALVGVAFLALMRVWPAGADIGFAVLATLAFGAGVGYATGLSPFVVCALAAAMIVHASPPARRHAIRRVLAEWERPVVAMLLVITGALLTLPTAWILLAVPFLAAARAAAKWADVRYGVRTLALASVPHPPPPPPPPPPNIGLGTIAQGSVAVALGVAFLLLYGAPSGAAVLTTVVLGVACALLAAPPLMALALRAPVVVSAPAPSAPLTEPVEPAELTVRTPVESPR